MTIDELRLSPVMDQRARELLDLFPSVQYLSGRREVPAQAHAMACQVVTNRNWIAETYLHAAVLQGVIEAHPECQTVEQIETLIAQTLFTMTPDERGHVSDHFDGNAVDLVPMEDATGQFTPTGQAVYTWIHDCPDTKKFLMREGGKTIWHWACQGPHA